MNASMGPTEELVEVDASALVGNFGTTMKTLDAMIAAAPAQPGGLDLDEVEVALSISADGKVAFVSNGGLPMRMSSSSIRVTLRRRRD